MSASASMISVVDASHLIVTYLSLSPSIISTIISPIAVPNTSSGATSKLDFSMENEISS